MQQQLSFQGRMTLKTLVATAGVDLNISRNEETTKYLDIAYATAT